MSRNAVTELLVVPHTHHDVGYTDTPRTAERLHRLALERALARIGNRSGDERSRFRWTVEVVRPLDRWLADEPEVAQKVLAGVQAGDLAVCAGYLNMTQLVDDGGYDRSFAPALRLRSLGIPIRAVQHGDVNGIGWGVVPAMRRAGLDTLVMALNPDHGRPPFEQPSVFWWRGLDGNRVLVALHNHYALGWEWGMLSGRPPAEDRVQALVTRLNRRDDYPYDFAVVHAAFDNRAPVDDVCTAVAAWNQGHPELPMRIATMNDVVERWWRGPVDTLPTYEGEWADWWAHGHGSSAREVAVARSAARVRSSATAVLANARLSHEDESAVESPQAEWYGPPLLAGNDRGLDRLADDLDEQLLLFQEHTWGSRESLTHPTSTFTRTHWSQKAAMAWRALDLAHDLSRYAGACALPQGAEAGDDVLAVVNSSAQPWRQMTVEEREGETVHVWIDCAPNSTTLAQVCRPVWTQVGPRTVLRLQGYELVVDPQAGGVVSLRHLDSGREIVDASAGFPLGALVYEVAAPESIHPMVAASHGGAPRDVPRFTNLRRYFHPNFPGPEFRREAARGEGDVEVTQAPDGTWSAVRWSVAIPDVLSAAVELVVSGSAVQLFVSLDKRPTLVAEGVYVTFPFAVDEPRFWLQTTDAVFEAEREQLPGTCRDWYSVQHAVGVAGGTGSGVVWGTLDAPLVQLGGFHTGEWADHLEVSGGAVNSWLMNNLYFTNFRAAQGGADRFAYVFYPSEAVDRGTTARLGEQLGRPPLTFDWQGYGGDRTLPHLVVPADWQIGDIRLTADGAVADIRSLAPTSTSGDVGWVGPQIWGHLRGNEPSPLGAGACLPVELGPYGQFSIHLQQAKGSDR